MENKRKRTAAAGASKARPRKQSVVEPAQEPVTYRFDLDEIQRINISAVAMAVVVPKPPPRFNVCIEIVVVPKPRTR